MFSYEVVLTALHAHHVKAPVTLRKIVDALQNEPLLMHAALNYYHEGKLTEYYLEE